MILIMSQELFEIKDILDRRIRKGQIQYLILWANFPRSAATWEPASNLGQIKELVQSYTKRNQPQNKISCKQKPNKISIKLKQVTPEKKKYYEKKCQTKRVKGVSLSKKLRQQNQEQYVPISNKRLALTEQHSESQQKNQSQNFMIEPTGTQIMKIIMRIQSKNRLFQIRDGARVMVIPSPEAKEKYSKAIVQYYQKIIKFIP